MPLNLYASNKTVLLGFMYYTMVLTVFVYLQDLCKLL